MSLPGNWEDRGETCYLISKKKSLPGQLTTNLPLKLAVGPIPVGADGGGDVTANTALWKQVQGGQFLVIQKGVAVVLVPHGHRGEELLAALGAGDAGTTGSEVPPGGRTVRERQSAFCEDFREMGQIVLLRQRGEYPGEGATSILKKPFHMINFHLNERIEKKYMVQKSLRAIFRPRILQNKRLKCCSFT